MTWRLFKALFLLSSISVLVWGKTKARTRNRSREDEKAISKYGEELIPLSLVERKVLKIGKQRGRRIASCWVEKLVGINSVIIIRNERQLSERRERKSMNDLACGWNLLSDRKCVLLNFICRQVWVLDDVELGCSENERKYYISIAARDANSKRRRHCSYQSTFDMSARL